MVYLEEKPVTASEAGLLRNPATRKVLCAYARCSLWQARWPDRVKEIIVRLLIPDSAKQTVRNSSSRNCHENLHTRLRNCGSMPSASENCRPKKLKPHSSRYEKVNLERDSGP